MCPAYRSKDDAFIDMLHISMSGVIDWLVQYVKDSYPALERDYLQQKRDIENNNEISDLRRAFSLDELKEKHSFGV